MAYELCYTSVPQGLRPGTSGFCTVGLTRGAPPSLVERLESLSGYRPLFPASSPHAALNPVAWAHWRVQAGGQSYSVLSRVCFAGLDHTQRSNKFAHHVAMTVAELPAAGPAWALAQPGLMRARWTGAPAEFDRGPDLPAGDEPPAACAAWAAERVDPGWAGALAESFLANPAKPAYLIYPPATDVLALVREALALVPPRQRWQVTFNTYFTDLPAGSTCAWRCCATGSPAADEARHAGGLLIDLTGPMPAAPDSPLARVARDGPGADLPVAEPMADVASPMGVDDLDAFPDPVARTLPVAGGPGRAGAGTASAPARATFRPTSAAARIAAAAGGANPAAAAGAADQSWMPPLNSTVVEGVDGRRVSGPTPPGTGGGGALKAAVVATIAAGMVAAGGTYIAMRSMAAGQVQAAEDRAKKKIDDADLATDNQKKRYNDLHDDVDRRLNAAKSAGVKEGRNSPDTEYWQPKVPRTGTAKSFTEAEHEALLASALDKQKRANDAAMATFMAAATQPATRKGPEPAPIALKPLDVPAATSADRPLVFVVSELPPAPAEVAICKLPATVRNPRLELVPAPDIKASFLVAASPAGSPPEVKVYRELKGLGGGGGADGTVTLCKITLADNRVLLNLPPIEDHDEDVRRREFLSTAMLTVKDDAGVQGAVQFWQMKTVPFTLADQPDVALYGTAPGVMATAQLTLLPIATNPPSPWTMGDPEPASVVFREAAGPAVKFTLSTSGLKCGYSELLNSARKTVQKLEGDVLNQANKAPKTEKGNPDWSKMTTPDGPLERQKYEKLLAEKERAAASVKSLMAFPNGSAVVRLKNGVVLYRINLVTSTRPS